MAKVSLVGSKFYKFSSCSSLYFFSTQVKCGQMFQESLEMPGLHNFYCTQSFSVANLLNFFSTKWTFAIILLQPSFYLPKTHLIKLQPT